MNGNAANGGLVVKWQKEVIFAKPHERFLNADNEYIYYVNRSDDNRLYRKRTVSEEGKTLLKKPCSGVVLFNGRLYFIDMDDMNVYACSTEGKNVTRCTDKNVKVMEFGLLPDGGVFTKSGAKRLCMLGMGAVYADESNTSNQYALTKFSARTEKTDVFPDIKPSSINVHEDNIYYADRTRQNMVYRMDAEGSAMQICGESAELLHVIDNWLYFLVNKKWKRLSLLNYGEAEEIN